VRGGGEVKKVDAVLHLFRRGRLLLSVLLKTSDCSCSYLEGEAALVRPPEDLRLLLLRWEWRPVLPPALLRLRAEYKNIENFVICLLIKGEDNRTEYRISTCYLQ
jgi:hypothetical protein